MSERLETIKQRCKYLDSKGLDALRVQSTGGQTKICEFDMSGTIEKEVLRG